MKLLVSACLLGENCKYSGGSNFSAILAELAKNHEVVAVCPEMLGGLSVPRHPCEIVSGVVRDKEGVSFDREFRLGAERALAIAGEEKIDMAVLQARSPSCGVNRVYDGTFSKTLREGKGLFAQLLVQNGFRVADTEDMCRIAEMLAHGRA